MQLYFRNPKTNRLYCCRGTNSNETDNLYLKLLTGHHLGIGRADRLISTYLEISNERKKVNRLGESYDMFCYKTEKLGFINSLYKAVGYDNEALPYPTLQQPAAMGDLGGADLGFDIQVNLPTGARVEDIVNETVSQVVSPAADDNAEDERLAGSVDNNATNAGDVDVNDPVGETEGSANSATDTGETNDTGLTNDNPVAEKAREEKIARLLPEIQARESTMQAFQRLTNNQPWIPFHSAVGPRSRLQEAEIALFEEMAKDYNYKLSPRDSSGKGYKAFETAWNLEVAKRYRASVVDGDEDVVLIHRKSVIQLQAHWKKTQELLGEAARMEDEDAVGASANNRNQMNAVLRQSRDSVPRMPPVMMAQPIMYPELGTAAFGNPLTFNASIARTAVAPAPQRNPAPWIVAPIVCHPLGALRIQNPLQGFRKRMYCTTCGFRRKDHVPGESFGDKCKRQLCGKCNQRAEFHGSAAGGRKLLMGPFCPRDPSPTLFNMPHWYQTSKHVSANP